MLHIRSILVLKFCGGHSASNIKSKNKQKVKKKQWKTYRSKLETLVNGIVASHRIYIDEKRPNTITKYSRHNPFNLVWSSEMQAMLYRWHCLGLSHHLPHPGCKLPPPVGGRTTPSATRLPDGTVCHPAPGRRHLPPSSRTVPSATRLPDDTVCHPAPGRRRLPPSSWTTLSATRLPDGAICHPAPGRHRLLPGSRTEPWPQCTHALMYTYIRTHAHVSWASTNAYYMVSGKLPEA